MYEPDVIRMKDGKVVTCFTSRDYTDYIREYCGDEFADVVGQYMSDIENEEAYEKERAHTDADAFEASCDSYHATICEALEYVDQILRTAEEHPRLKKETILKNLRTLSRRLAQDL